MAKFYVLDTRMSWKLFLFLIPSAIAIIYRMTSKYSENEERIELYDKHMVCNLKNLEEGRYHTILTSALGGSGNITGHIVSDICSLLLFGGFFIRNIGLLKTALYFYGAHTASTGLSLLFSHIPIKKIQKYREWVHTGEEAQFAPYKIRMEKKKIAMSIEAELAYHGVHDIFEIERKQREVLRMEDNDFLNYATDHYKKRNAHSTGAGLGLTFLISCLFPRGMIPLPYIGLPLLIFTPVQLYLSIQSYYQYSTQELLAHTSAMIILPVLTSLTWIKRDHFVRDLPNEVMDHLKMASWIPRRRQEVKAAVENKVKKAFQAIPGMEGVKNLSKEQIEQMRKRNLKVKNKVQKK